MLGCYRLIQVLLADQHHRRGSNSLGEKKQEDKGARSLQRGHKNTHQTHEECCF